MGTSASSPGPGPGVPMVPPWVPPVEPTQPPPGPDAPPPNDNPAPPDAPPRNPPSPVPPPDLAPPGRFRAARLNLGRFGHGGRQDSLRKGLRHYVRHGMGGAATGARRMAGTARTAGLLHSVLSALSAGQTPPVSVGVDPRSLAGRSARELSAIIIEAVRPTDGTQDAEAARAAMYEAQVDLLQQFPDADLAALNSEQIDLVVQRYIGHDLSLRIDLDVGQAVMAHAPNAATAVHRLEEIKQYVVQTVDACFRQHPLNSSRMDQKAFTSLAQSVLREALDVFEEYIK